VESLNNVVHEVEVWRGGFTFDDKADLCSGAVEYTHVQAVGAGNPGMTRSSRRLRYHA